MNLLDSYRNPAVIKKISESIKSIPLKNEEVKLMEVCGTHTMAIRKFAIDTILPDNVRLLSGPGCPVCVTPALFIDTAIRLVDREDIILTTFGDMVRVPGTESSLEAIKAKGKHVEIVYSPIEALKLAEKYKDKKTVFLAIGFETTAPSIALTVMEAHRRKIKNFFILEGNRLIPPAIETILRDPESKIDGFILPGHVCTITGDEDFRFIPEAYGIPCVISGFEPLDILIAVKTLLEMISTGRADVVNAYPRVVKRKGNSKAKDIMVEVFKKTDALWRGLGYVKESGLRLKEKFCHFNILNHIEVDNVVSRENPACRCGDVLKGKIYPYQCALFGTLCTPTSPKGPCMISTEGSCAAYYKYSQ